MNAPLFGPLFGPLFAPPPPPLLAGAQAEELRAQMIVPLALGADSGRHMAPGEAVVPVSAIPDRPSLSLTLKLAPGDSFTGLLARAGLGGPEAARVAAVVARVVPPAGIAPGTQLSVTLGKRPAPAAARPLERLAMRARFDLDLLLERDGDGFRLTRTPIAVDATPLRISGPASAGIYRTARAAGAPPQAVAQYLRLLQSRLPVAGVAPDDRFDMIIARHRAATGEVQFGDLLYAGLTRSIGKPVQLMRWQDGGAVSWFEASGVGQNRGQLMRPVSGGISSGFGMRFHPILGYMRMHSGIDFHAAWGTPIRAAADGVVTYAGGRGGYGNFVELAHANSLATGYAHMSRIAAYAGEHVRAGQVIGFVGSTGLSTGPHLHWELTRRGVPIDPLSLRFTSQALLSGPELAAFRARLKQLQAVLPGAALASAMLARPGPPALPQR